MSQEPQWNTRKEYLTVFLLALGFGLVGVDRFIIAPIFPVMMVELDLDYTDLGIITGALSFAWGIAAFVIGSLSDRLGRRKVLTWSMIIFSVLVGFSGLATGLVTLVLIRIVMGFAEGAYTSPSIAATIEASRPHRQGLNLGIQQMFSPLLALGLMPILITELLQYIDWRYIFLLSAFPGIILAWFLWRHISDTPHGPAVHSGHDIERASLKLINRNIVLLMVCMVCWINALVVLSMLLPGYMHDMLGMPLNGMGRVLSAMGFGAVLGSVGVPALSDLIGRKRALALAAAIGLGATIAMSQVGAQPWVLFGWLFMIMFCVMGAITVTVGPLAASSLPPGMAATASGMVIAAGEFFGGGVAPILAGAVVERGGLPMLFPLAAIGLGVGVIAAAMLREPAVAVPE